MAPQPLAPLPAMAALETGVYVREFILDRDAVRQVRYQVTKPLKINRIKRMSGFSPHHNPVTPGKNVADILIDPFIEHCQGPPVRDFRSASIG